MSKPFMEPVGNVENKIEQAYAEVLPVQFHTIPLHLQGIDNWTAWIYALNKNGELKKPPIDPKTGRYADHTNSATWGTLAQAEQIYKERKLAGVGFVLTRELGIVGIDIDHCVKNGVIHPKALWVIRTIASYAEFSPSKTGIHIFVKGVIPGEKNRYKHVEIYQDERYLTVTGHKIEGTLDDILENQAGLEMVYERIFAHQHEEQTRKKHSPSSFLLPQELQPSIVDDEVIIKRATRYRNGDIVARLLRGDASLWGEGGIFPSKSEADFHLCRKLYFWGADRSQIERIFRGSGLIDEKWDERHGSETYGSETITNAMNGEQADMVTNPRKPFRKNRR